MKHNPKFKHYLPEYKLLEMGGKDSNTDAKDSNADANLLSPSQQSNPMKLDI